MPCKHDIVEAASLFQTNTTAKVIEWKPKAHSRGIRDVPVEVHATASQPRPRKKARRRARAENKDPLQAETAPQPMDVDETSWADEPAMPTSENKVKQPACPSFANLTNLPVPALIHRRIYPKDWPILTLPPRFRGRSSNDHVPELQVCSV